MNNELLLTAIHEAGHAVAHARLECSALVTIKPHNGMFGRCKLPEGKDHVSNAEDARVQVLCYCAGYAALIAAGYSDKSARLGADDDFRKRRRACIEMAIYRQIGRSRKPSCNFL